MDRKEMVEQVRTLVLQRSTAETRYWDRYSDPGTLPFWINLAILVVPLIVLIYLLDRKRLFEILFFGFIIHMLMNYADAFAVAHGYVHHPYPIVPAVPINLSINTSLIPVLFMLTYQYASNTGKNIPLFGFFASMLTGLGLGALAVATDYLRLYKGMNVGLVFLVDYSEFLVAYGLTTLLLWLRERTGRLRLAE